MRRRVESQNQERRMFPERQSQARNNGKRPRKMRISVSMDLASWTLWPLLERCSSYCRCPRRMGGRRLGMEVPLLCQSRMAVNHGVGERQQQRISVGTTRRGTVCWFFKIGGLYDDDNDPRERERHWLCSYRADN